MKIDARMAERIRLVMQFRGMETTAELSKRLAYADGRDPFAALNDDPFAPFQIQRSLPALAAALGIENHYDLKGTLEHLRLKLDDQKAALLRATLTPAPKRPGFLRRLLSMTQKGIQS